MPTSLAFPLRIQTRGPQRDKSVFSTPISNEKKTSQDEHELTPAWPNHQLGGEDHNTLLQVVAFELSFAILENGNFEWAFLGYMNGGEEEL